MRNKYITWLSAAFISPKKKKCCIHITIVSNFKQKLKKMASPFIFLYQTYGIRSVGKLKPSFYF